VPERQGAADEEAGADGVAEIEVIEQQQPLNDD
jgi:hypothetical protein